MMLAGEDGKALQEPYISSFYNELNLGFEVEKKLDCCFDHYHNMDYQQRTDVILLLPYQRTLYDSLQNHKHIWI